MYLWPAKKIHSLIILPLIISLKTLKTLLWTPLCLATCDVCLVVEVVGWEMRGENSCPSLQSGHISLGGHSSHTPPPRHINRWNLRQSPGMLRLSGGKIVGTTVVLGEGNLKMMSITCQLILIETRRIFVHRLDKTF